MDTVESMQREAASPLRILFVTSDKFPPFRPAAKLIFSEGIVEAGHRVDWVLQSATAVEQAGIVRHGRGWACVAPSFDGGSRLTRLCKHWADLRNDLRIGTLLGRRRYSLVQVKDKYFGALVALAAGRRHGVPVFYWLAYPHGEASQYAARQRVARYALWYWMRGALQRFLLYRVILRACTHVFVQSEQMRLDLAREGIPKRKMTAVPSSIDLAEIDAAMRTKYGSPGVEPLTDRRTVVYLGTLLRERRLDFLVRAFAKLRAAMPDARLVFIGRGENPEDERLLRAQAERLGVRDDVRITGWMPMHAAWRLVRSAGVCVSPYYPTPILLSTSPTKLVEYMALGKAVVANDHPEQSLVLKESGGGFLCRWDESEFATALQTLLAHPQLADSMGLAGRRFVEAHRSHTVMTNLVLSTYHDALMGGSARPARTEGVARAPRWPGGGRAHRHESR